MKIDYLLHFLCGYLIADITTDIIPAISLLINFQLPGILGLTNALLGGIAKECFDKYIRKTVWSWNDMFYTTGGGILDYSLSLI